MTGRVGLVLGSGGARGWCHIGVLSRLAELGIQPGVVVGCSMGALVGAAFAAGRLAQLEEWARSLTIPRFIGLLDLSLRGGGLVAGGEITALIRRLEMPERIEDLPIPFAAVATDMQTGREVWLRQGVLADAVRASVAIPGVLTPWQVEGRWMLDGGMTNPVPVSLARALGAEIIIAANPDAKLDGLLWRANAGRGAPWRRMAESLPEPMRGVIGPLLRDDRPVAPSYFDVISTAIDVMTEQIRRSRLAGDPPQVLLSADLPDMSIMDLHRAADAIAEGRRMVDADAARLAALLG